MNIREAKEQIEHAVKLYLEKDEKGRYIIPTEKQRPVFLNGAHECLAFHQVHRVNQVFVVKRDGKRMAYRANLQAGNVKDAEF